MQVKETTNEALKRGFEITVPQAEVAKAEAARLEEIAKKAKVQGFRPGKAPLSIIRQRYAAEVQGEVLDRLINENVEKLLKERNLRPALRPHVDLVSAGEGKDLSFKVEVEVLPEITAPDFSKLSFEKQVADVAPKTIDEAIERIAKSMRQPQAIETKRACKKGDTVEIDFDGTVDGVAHPGMKSENHRLELGSQSFIDGFEDQIAGLKVGDKKDVKVTFPAAYHAEHLSGKDAVFAVTLKAILEHVPVEQNEELAKEIGFPSLEKLRERISTDISNNYAQISRVVLKRALMDKLAETTKFELPASMVENEFQGIWQQVQKDKAEGQLSAEDAKKSDKALEAEYKGIAERRVRLGLLLAEVAEKNKLEVSPVELRNAMIAEARRFPGQEKAVIDYYTKTAGAVERLRAPLLEEKVVDFILALAKITEKKIDAEKLMKLPEEMD